MFRWLPKEETFFDLFTAGGLAVLNWPSLTKIGYAMVFSPVGGFIGGFALMLLTYWAFRRFLPAVVTRVFRHGQVVSAAFMAFAHGANDTQNAMGAITAALLPGGFLSEFKVPVWVIAGSAFFMGLGTSVGGCRRCGGESPATSWPRGCSRSPGPRSSGPGRSTW